MTKSTRYSQKRWSLASLYPAYNSPEMKAAYKELETLTAAFEKKRRLLTDKISQSEFMTMIQELEKLYRIGHRLGSFAELWFTDSAGKKLAAAQYTENRDSGIVTMKSPLSPSLISVRPAGAS